MATNRDDFKKDIVEALAKRACYHCSNPGCRAPTLMPSAVDPGNFIYSGIASHITAAASGGPRFDASLSPQERAAINNGIHLCVSCSVKIDKNNGIDYPTPILYEWKQKHEEWISNLGKATIEGLEAAFQDTFARTTGRDILTLVRETRLTLASLAQYACIKTASALVRIGRSSAAALKKAVDNGSLVVVGEPGSGKSGATYEAIETLLAEGTNVIALNAGRLAAPSLGILRTELNLSLPIHEILAHWQPDRPGLLVIDGLDGARTQGATDTLRDLIQHIVEQNSQWHVLVSIRKFDLRHSPRLQRLFNGEPVDGFSDPEFRQIRHISIPLLTDEELEQAAAQSAEIAGLIVQAPVALRELLRVPFNLRLAGDLAGGNVRIASLTPISTQIGLLECYWQERVIGEDGNGDSREVVIRRALEGMLQRGLLQVDRRAAMDNETSASAALLGVLHAHVLIESQHKGTGIPDGSILAFAHHILYDYAAARLLLRGLPDSLIECIAKNPDLVVSIRPSFVLHFQYLWDLSEDRATFWDWVLAIVKAEAVPAVGKLIGPTVAAEQAKRLSDLEYLVAQAETECLAAEQAVHYVRGAATALNHSLSGSMATPWCEFVECCTRLRKPNIVNTLCSLLMELCDQIADLNTGQLTALGLTARRLLETAWAQVPPNSWLANHAISAVCQTFSSDAVASEMLLRRTLEPPHLAKWGYQELPTITEYIHRLFQAAPELVGDIYRAGYAYTEESQEKTALPGVVLPMTSTRSQDYSMAVYKLAEAYPTFLRKDPEWAVVVLVNIISDAVAKQEELRAEEPHKVHFPFGEVMATLCSDSDLASYDPDVASHYDCSKLLQDFTNYLIEIGNRPECIEERQKVLEVVLRSNQHAVVWRRLIEAAVTTPETLGQELKSLLWTLPILTHAGTYNSAAVFLKVMFPRLSPAERTKTEEAILSIPEVFPEERPEYTTWLRDRLLNSLNKAQVTLTRTRLALDELANEMEELRILVSEAQEAASPLTADEADLIAQEVITLTAGIEVLARKHINDMPTAAEVEEGLPKIRKLYSLLADTPFTEETLQRWQDHAWGYLASACVAVLRYLPTHPDPNAAEFLPKILLSASTYPDPKFDEHQNAQFARSPSWHWPCARLDAAIGLIQLASQGEAPDETIVHAIERLSQDGTASIRYQIAGNLHSFYHTMPETAQRIVNYLVKEEVNLSVVIKMVRSLAEIVYKQTSWVMETVASVHARYAGNVKAAELRRECAALFTRWYIYNDDMKSKAIINGFMQDVTTNSREAIMIAQFLRPLLTIGSTTLPNSIDNSRRRRAVELLEHVLHSTKNQLSHLLKQYEDIPIADWLEASKSAARALYEVVDWIGTEVYFASGTFGEKQNPAPQVNGPLDAIKKRRFLTELGPVMEDLTKFANPRCAYHMLELFESYIDIEPKRIFLLMDRTIADAQSVGFQYDHMTVKVVVRLVSRFMAEYPQLLRSDIDCRQALLRILDTFVVVGWPEAIRLAYRLNDIYR